MMADVRRVSRFEARLIGMARSIVGVLPGEQMLPWLVERQPVPPCLSRACVELLQQTLAQGCVNVLARAGGWRVERFLRDGSPAAGRLWQRTPPRDLGMRFSANAVGFLIWLSSAAVSPGGRPVWDVDPAELTVGDDLLIFLAYDRLVETDTGKGLRAQGAVRRNALCRLAYPDRFPEESMPIDFDPWTRAPGSAVLEALQPRLRDRWVAVERSKPSAGDWNKARALGASQERVWEAFASAAERSNRRDLARFAVRAWAETEPIWSSPEQLVGRVAAGSVPMRLAERLEFQRQVAATARFVERLDRWSRWARATGYLDDDYGAAQLYLKDWEQHHGPDLAARARDLLRRIEPLAATAPEAP